MGEIPKFSDLVESRTLDGDKKTLDEIAGKRIIVTAYRVKDSKYNHKGGGDKCATLQFYFADDPEEKRHVVFTGSSVLTGQLGEIEQELTDKSLPFVFETVIQKIGDKYWSFT